MLAYDLRLHWSRLVVESNLTALCTRRYVRLLIEFLHPMKKGILAFNQALLAEDVCLLAVDFTLLSQSYSSLTAKLQSALPKRWSEQGVDAYLTLHACIKYEVLYQCNLKPITKLQLHIHLHRFTTTIIISLSIYPTTGGSCERFSVHTRGRHLMIVPSWLQQRTCILRTYCYKYTLIIRCEWNQNDQY